MLQIKVYVNCALLCPCYRTPFVSVQVLYVQLAPLEGSQETSSTHPAAAGLVTRLVSKLSLPVSVPQPALLRHSSR
jgi:hypothetical protein